jgi:hypothetical protein
MSERTYTQVAEATYVAAAANVTRRGAGLGAAAGGALGSHDGNGQSPTGAPVATSDTSSWPEPGPAGAPLRWPSSIALEHGVAAAAKAAVLDPVGCAVQKVQAVWAERQPAHCAVGCAL